MLDISNPYKVLSEKGYLFTSGNSVVSWQSMKQTMVSTSSNHSELLVIRRASYMCIWLRSIIQHIRQTCGLSSIKNNPIILYEDNAACIAQIKGGYIKGYWTKHILSKLFNTLEFQKNSDIDIQQISSSDNLTDLFTKSLPNCDI